MQPLILVLSPLLGSNKDPLAGSRNEAERRLTMTNEKDTRLGRYAALASVPTLGAVGIGSVATLGTNLNADIIHYGGPAIEISRTDATSGKSTEGHWMASGGTHGIFSTASTASRGAGGNFYLSKQANEADDSLQKRKAALGMNFGDLDSTHFIGTDAFKGLVEMYSADQLIGSSNFNAQSGYANLAKSFAFEGSKSSSSFSSGDWAIGMGSGEEARGFAAFAVQDEGEMSYGWLDIGWDGDTLTIYDWALSTGGSIRAGQTAIAVPGTTGLAALAMGAAGMRRRRKRSA